MRHNVSNLPHNPIDDVEKSIRKHHVAPILAFIKNVHIQCNHLIQEDKHFCTIYVFLNYLILVCFHILLVIVLATQNTDL